MKRPRYSLYRRLTLATIPCLNNRGKQGHGRQAGRCLSRVEQIVRGVLSFRPSLPHRGCDRNHSSVNPQTMEQAMRDSLRHGVRPHYRDMEGIREEELCRQI